MKPPAVNQYLFRRILNFDPHSAETSDRRQTVRSLKKMSNLSCTFGQCPEHNGTMGNGLVSGDFNLTVKSVGSMNFHNYVYSFLIVDSLSFIYDIPMLSEQSGSFIAGIAVVEFNSKNAFFKFAVIYNSDILDIDTAARKDRSDCCNAAGLIRYVAVDGERLPDRSR